jgi:hypothetical protein
MTTMMRTQLFTDYWSHKKVKRVERRVTEIVETTTEKFLFALKTGNLKGSIGNAYNWGDAK